MNFFSAQVLYLCESSTSHIKLICTASKFLEWPGFDVHTSVALQYYRDYYTNSNLLLIKDIE